MSTAFMKIVLTGDPDVGKTSLIHRFVEDTFSQEYLPTLGFQIFVKTMKINDRIVDFQIWDVGGGQSFRFVRKSYYRGSHGFIMVFDVGNAESLRNLETWLAEIREVSPHEPFVLVGNKIDLPDQRITATEINAKCESWGACGKILTSAKTGTNVNELFLILGRAIIADFK